MSFPNEKINYTIYFLKFIPLHNLSSMMFWEWYIWNYKYFPLKTYVFFIIKKHFLYIVQWWAHIPLVEICPYKFKILDMFDLAFFIFSFNLWPCVFYSLLYCYGHLCYIHSNFLYLYRPRQWDLIRSKIDLLIRLFIILKNVPF